MLAQRERITDASAQYVFDTILASYESQIKSRYKVQQAIVQATEDIELIQAVRDDLLHAISFAQGGAQIVSMSEYKKMKFQLQRIYVDLKEKEVGIRRMLHLERSIGIECDQLKAGMEKVIRQSKTGLVLAFKRGQ